MNVRKDLGEVTTSIQLTEDQRNALGAALGIDANLIPTQLGVVGVSAAGSERLGMPTREVRFSPALVMV